MWHLKPVEMVKLLLKDTLLVILPKLTIIKPIGASAVWKPVLYATTISERNNHIQKHTISISSNILRFKWVHKMVSVTHLTSEMWLILIFCEEIFSSCAKRLEVERGCDISKTDATGEECAFTQRLIKSEGVCRRTVSGLYCMFAMFIHKPDSALADGIICVYITCQS